MTPRSLVRVATLTGFFLSTAALGPCTPTIPLANGGDGGTSADLAPTTSASDASTQPASDASTQATGDGGIQPGTLTEIQGGNLPAGKINGMFVDGSTLYLEYTSSLVALSLPYNPALYPVVTTVLPSQVRPTGVFPWATYDASTMQSSIATYVDGKLAFSYTAPTASLLSGGQVFGSNIYFGQTDFSTASTALLTAPVDGSGAATSIVTIPKCEGAYTMTDASTLYYLPELAGPSLVKMTVPGGVTTTIVSPSDAVHGISTYTFDSSYVYWADVRLENGGDSNDPFPPDYGLATINRAELDGSNKTVLASNVYMPEALFVNGGQLYFTTPGPGTISDGGTETYPVSVATMPVTGGTPTILGTTSGNIDTDGAAVIAGDQLFLLTSNLFVLAK